MASALDERLAEMGYDQLWEQLAAQVTYGISATGATSAVNAIFSNDPSQVDFAPDGVTRLMVGNVEFRTTGVDAVASPARNDTVVVNGETWTLNRALETRAGWERWEVTRVETIAKGNPYRERR